MNRDLEATKDKHPKATLYLADRDAGMKYRDIAAKYGVSHQAVAQVCARARPGHFKPFTKEEVVYPNLRRWLNENKVCKYEFVRRMGDVPSPTASTRVSNWFRGRHFPQKQTIDKILAATGLTYEELFAEDEADRVEI